MSCLHGREPADSRQIIPVADGPGISQGAGQRETARGCYITAGRAPFPAHKVWHYQLFGSLCMRKSPRRQSGHIQGLAVAGRDPGSGSSAVTARRAVRQRGIQARIDPDHLIDPHDSHATARARRGSAAPACARVPLRRDRRERVPGLRGQSGRAGWRCSRLYHAAGRDQPGLDPVEDAHQQTGQLDRLGRLR